MPKKIKYIFSLLTLLFLCHSCKETPEQPQINREIHQELLKLKKVISDEIKLNDLVYYKSYFKEYTNIDSFFNSQCYSKCENYFVINWRQIDTVSLFEDEYTIQLKDSILKLRCELKDANSSRNDNPNFEPMVYFYYNIFSIAKYHNAYKIIAAGNTLSGSPDIFYIINNGNKFEKINPKNENDIRSVVTD